MKRYLIFMWSAYESGGGAGDFKGSADTKDEIKTIIFNNGGFDRMNILDAKTQKIEWVEISDDNEYCKIDCSKVNKSLESIIKDNESTDWKSKIVLDRKDLISLAKGTMPNGSVANDGLIRGKGYLNSDSGWEWKWDAFENLTDVQIYNIYVKYKNSWNK